MSLQSSSASQTASPMSSPGRAPKEPVAPAPVWLQRMSLVVFVLFCFYIGGILAVLPWSPRYWDQNGWLMAHPAIDAIAIQGWMRGLISGIGLVDVWIGISELIHYRDFKG
ncbi:hypothetical protein SAMN05421819_3714 [Bryocella elongata]|uniref:Uncharacterized protein n=1 Tax=Bryocella elongata TaxID=863522 RepID=A0A1H6BI03_9BACT|nr:hypothetical protein SAMN05421819_3714 [Bryocella elongata]